MIAVLASDYAFGRDGVKAAREFTKGKAKVVHEEYAAGAARPTSPPACSASSTSSRISRATSTCRWAGRARRQPFPKIADLELEKRYGIKLATGGNILPAMVAYKSFPGMEGALYYYFGIPKNPVNEWLVANHYKQFKGPPDFFTAGGMSAAMAVVEALKKTTGDTSTNKLIATMEGMSFDTPKGKMTFRKEDHQAMQDMYHFRIKNDPAFAWGVPELVRVIPAAELNIPIRNKRWNVLLPLPCRPRPRRARAPRAVRSPQDCRSRGPRPPPGGGSSQDGEPGLWRAWMTHARDG